MNPCNSTEKFDRREKGNMVTELATRQSNPAAVLEKVIVHGDLEALTPAERVQYYEAICDSMGLNALGRPFEYLKLNNKLVLYARKEATDQIREKRGVSIVITARERLDDLYIVTARATMPDGRTDESTGVVTIGGMKGDFLANACMKAETKSKRRVTLSICGLGFLDESEVETIAGAKRVIVADTGEIIDIPAITGATPIRQEPPAATDGEIPTFANVGEFMTWASKTSGIKQSRELLSFLGCTTVLEVRNRYPDLSAAAQAILANVPPDRS